MGVLPIEIKSINFKISGNEIVKFNVDNLDVKNIDIYFNNKKIRAVIRIDSKIQIRIL